MPDNLGFCQVASQSREVEGSFPTKHGELHVRYEKNADGSVATEIRKPAGLLAQ